MSADDDMAADLNGLLNELSESAAPKTAAKKTAAKKAAAAPPPEPEPLVVDPVEETPETLETSAPAAAGPVLTPELMAELTATIKAQVLAEFREKQAQSRADRETATLNAINARHKGSNELDAPKGNPLAMPEVEDPSLLPQMVHFVADGLTINGTVTYRGLEYEPNKYDTWALLDEWEQIERWGEVKFRPGPWGGRGFDLTDPNLTEDERKKLAAIMKNRLAQRVSAPVPTEA